jgi:Kef-type K+ transport system membrane component KefB
VSAGAVALLMALAALASAFGLEAILGAFLAGATLKLLDRDQAMTHSLFRTKLQAVGFGAFVPFFVISTGMSLDVRGLVTSGATLAKVPIFLAALLIARAAPAVLYRPRATGRAQLVAAGLLSVIIFPLLAVPRLGWL